MNHDHHAGALISVITAWGLALSSFIVNSIPYIQWLSITLACIASVYAIRFYRGKA